MTRGGTSTAPDAARVAALQRALLAWSEQTRRDLPWRRTRDPWAVLVAEQMLQQTQVARVVGRYEAFLDRWPDAASCAAAGRAAVVTAWQGLGYNRRAVALHAAAAQVVADHGGVVPEGVDDLLALPGVGPYTARAVRAFAYERDDGVLDVNAARFLARCVAGERLRPARAQALADALVPSGHGWAWNQAVLDLGATVCTRRTPHCDRCPLATWCVWRGDGPDPSIGSAGAGGRQSAFEGSDRQGRGRLLDRLREGPLPRAQAGDVMAWDDPDRVARVLDGLVVDGLVAQDAGTLRLAP